MGKEAPCNEISLTTKVTPEVSGNRLRLANRLSNRFLLPNHGVIANSQELGYETREDALDRAEQLVQEGRGLIFVYNHFSITDPIRALQALYRESPVIRDLTLMSPIDIYQSEKFQRILNYLSEHTTVALYPIVIDKTLERHGIEDGTGEIVYMSKDGPKKKSDGIGKYMDALKEAVTHGQSAIVSIDAGRQHSLYPDTSIEEIDERTRKKEVMARPLNLIAAKLRHDADKVAVVFIGMGLRDAQEYAKGKTDGFNRGKTVNYIIGPTIKLEDLITHAAETGKSVDDIARSTLEQSVPEAYLRPIPQGNA
jgi:hypothetical protein